MQPMHNESGIKALVFSDGIYNYQDKRCTERTTLSTQFYGGKKALKKRIKNILLRKKKKNDISILICAVIITISFGTLAGCSMTKENAEEVSEQSESENILPVEDAPADNDILENTTVPESSDEEVEKEDKTVLKVMREGEMDEIPATLFAGEGYSIYLTDGDWQQHAPDAWSGAFDGELVLNGQVQLWITHYEDKTANQVKEELESDGYTSENSDIIKQESEVIYKVRLYESGNDVWGVFYCYPIEAEEGWGALLPLIADTFAVSTGD